MTDSNITEELRRGRLNASEKKIVTTNDLPVYRMAANVLYMLTDVCAHAPRKLLRLTDNILNNASCVLEAIALANMMRGQSRTYYINVAEAHVVVMKSHLRILQRQGVVSSGGEKKMRTYLRQTGAQLAGWRNSVDCEGHT